MGDEGNNLQLRIEALEGELHTLQAAVYKRDLARAAEEVIFNSPFVRMGMRYLGTAITLGVVVWIGGTIYSGIQIKGVQEQAAEVKRQMSDFQTEVERRLAEQTKRIDDDARTAAEEIRKQTKGVRDAATVAIKDAGDQQAIVRQKLDVDKVPDIQQLKGELAALAQAGGKLNLHCLTLLSGYSVWVLFGAAGLSLVLSIWALLKAWGLGG